MTLTGFWLAGLLGAPLVTAVLCQFEKERSDRIRSLATACAILSTALASLVYFVPDFQVLRVPWPGADSAVLGGSLLRVTSLSLPLIAVPPALWLITVGATPSARLDVGGLARTAVATSSGTLAFLTDSPALLACCWTLSSLLFLKGLTSVGTHRTKRVVAGYQLLSVFLLVGGIVVTSSGDPSDISGLWLIISAVLIRKGIFPFHAWIPEVLDRGRIGPTVLFSAPQLGTFVAATLVVPYAPPETLRMVSLLSLFTALYGAALALFQSDARRALGYLFVSQSALVLAGLDCTSEDALTGAMILWLSSAFAFTGLARTVLALEARRGRLRLTSYHGGFEQMPLLATTFLMFGLALTGFPGTLGFIGQEMLIDGAVRSFPTVGFLTIGASALTGLAVLRMYFSLFCGAPGGTAPLQLHGREKLVFGTVAIALVAAGIAPKGIVTSREHASSVILDQRADRKHVFHDPRH